MRIDRVEAHAFGPFRDEQLELAPGLTVVYGPNESGKSSWHAAIFGGLCGLRHGGGLRSEDRRFEQRHRPWDAGDGGWHASVHVTLADGRSIHLHADLDGRNDYVVDAVTGEDVVAELDLENEGAPDGARLLGLTRRTILATIQVRQADVLGVLEAPDGLQHQLQRAATSGGETTAERAIARIDDFHGERVGSLHPHSKRPLKAAHERVEATGQRLAEVRAAHDEHVGHYAELQELRRRVGELDRQLQAGRAVRGRRELRRIRARHREVSELAEEIASLPARPNGETEPDPEVLDLASELDDARRRLAFHHDSEPGASPGAEPTEGEVPAGPPRRLPYPRALVGGGGLAAVVGIVLIATGAVAAGLVLALAGAGAAGAGAYLSGGGDEDADADDVEAQLRDRARSGWQWRAEQLRQEVEQRGRRLGEALAERGLDAGDGPGAEVDKRLRAYRWACRQRREQAEQAGRRDELQERLERLLDGSSLQQLAREVERHRRSRPAMPEGMAWEQATDAAARLEQLQAEAAEARDRLARLESRSELQQAASASVAAAEEDHQRARDELARLEALGQTLELTRGFLEDARERVQREFAPLLREAVEAELPTITGGRYQRVRVDPESLQVRVSPDGARWRHASWLSQGTAEQIYLLLRVAMAEHVVTGDEPAPLILDDVTVHSDPQRTQRMLALLHRLSGERQVVVFTQEPEARDWARGRLGDRDRVVELDPGRIPA